MSTAHQLTPGDVEASKKSSAPTSGGNILNDNGTFMPSVESNTIAALLLVMENLLKIANTYGRLLINQLKTQSSIADTIAEFTVDAANDEANSVRVQGITSIVGGGLALGAAGLTMAYTPSDIKDLDGQIAGAKNYRDYMDEGTAGTGNVYTADGEKVGSPEVLESHIDALEKKPDAEFLKKRGGWFSKSEGVDLKDIKSTPNFKEDREKIDLVKRDEPRLKTLKEKYDEKIKDLRKHRDARQSELSGRQQGINSGIQALNGTITGSGQVRASEYKAEEGVDKASQSQAQSAQSTAQAIASQTRQHTDEYLQQSQSVNGVIGSINQANTKTA